LKEEPKEQKKQDDDISKDEIDDLIFGRK